VDSVAPSPKRGGGKKRKYFWVQIRDEIDLLLVSSRGCHDVRKEFPPLFKYGLSNIFL